METQDSSNSSIIAVKAVSMVIMFGMIMVLGNLPLRWKRFKTSPWVISLASGFSGGLFLAVGVLHLLPEASESFEGYYESQKVEGAEEEGEEEEHFPWPNFICLVCFAFVLYIEKVAFVSWMGDDHHEGHGHHHANADGHVHLPIGLKTNMAQELQARGVPSPTNAQTICIAHRNDEEETRFQGEEQMKTIQPVDIVIKPLEIGNEQMAVAEEAKRVSVSFIDGNERQLSKMTPYILQVAIGIHAVFEGLAIGLETDVSSCLGIALAVVCHKWAEGLTLGLAFYRAKVDLKMATIMIAIQAVMNPLGIMIGWLLSGQGDLVRGIFESISAGTFLYIAAVEVIVNEFSLKRYRHLKFLLFLLALGFVSSLFFIEQATSSD